MLRMSFSPEIRLPAAHRREVQGPPTSTPLSAPVSHPWASNCTPASKQLDAQEETKNLLFPYEGTTNLMGFTLSLANVGLFSSWASPSALETRRKGGCPTAARTLITPGPWNPQPNVLSHIEAEVLATVPSPTSSLRHLGVLFKDNEPLNHCF